MASPSQMSVPGFGCRASETAALLTYTSAGHRHGGVPTWLSRSLIGLRGQYLRGYEETHHGCEDRPFHSTVLLGALA